MKLTVPKNVAVPLNWATLTTSDDQDWCFGVNLGISQNLQEQIKGPQIYRFMFMPPSPGPTRISGITQIYIGESEHFENRCARYIRALAKLRRSAVPVCNMSAQSLGTTWKEMQRNPCVRVAAALQNAEIEKIRVKLQILKFAEFSINGIEISAGTMGSPFVRRFLENLAILTSDGPGIHLMNQGRSLEAKQFAHMFESVVKKNAAPQRSQREMGEATF